MIGTWEILVILLMVLLLFGGKKLPEFAKSLGQGIKEFKRAYREISEEIDTPPPPKSSQKPSSSHEQASEETEEAELTHSTK